MIVGFDEWYPEQFSHPDVRVSGLSWTIPKGNEAPGYVWPYPPVPIKGSTESKGEWDNAGVAFIIARRTNDEKTRKTFRIGPPPGLLFMKHWFC